MIPAGLEVNVRGLVPSGWISLIVFPVLKAIRLPSGDQAGEVSRPVPAGAVQIDDTAPVGTAIRSSFEP
jgi:hypothetical protein